MSALLPKADMCSALAHVCFGPIADIGTTLARQLLDHLVGDLLQMYRYVEAQRLGGLHIDHQLKLRWLHDRQVGGLRALEYFCDVNAGLAIRIVLPASVAHQAADLWKFAREIDGGHYVTRSPLDEFVGKTEEHRIAAYDKRAGTPFEERRKGRVDVGFAGRVQHLEPYSKGARRGLGILGFWLFSRIIRVHDEPDYRRCRHELAQKLQPLPCKLNSVKGHARNIASRTAEACNQA